MSENTGLEPATPDQQAPNDDDLKELLAKRQHAKPNKATWILLALITIGLGFAMGACTQKQVSSFSERSEQSEQPEIASDPAGAIGGQPPAVPGGDTTVGTVESLSENSLTIVTRDGRTVEVTVSAETPVTSSVEVPLEELPVGASVIVRGPTADDGSVIAESISEGAGLPGGRGERAP
ncbi:MAG: hypothetical protein K9G24_09540 [Candidatus Nanopelagicales bacterium]|nr:hypothetical protein [Candidatus Nanopelagicales bacterium]MCF8538398.1 hypothetical protein [Candidatus Nanopelagicales bacterium]MCF8543307.1 hypothetical protein [Candidatus Nanopelagicales bacterium]MCF8556590.1 hypothetical protein [Candidatus Nanopelagicales bacterium]